MFRLPGTVRGRGGALLGAALAAVSLAGLAPAASAAPAPADQSGDTSTLVNPLIGTGSGGQHVGQVDTFPGATAPFGMLSMSPETTSRPSGGGYDYADKSVTGFSLTHLSGVGCTIDGDIPILPTTGAIGQNPGAASEPFQHSDEQARPGYYATKLGAAGQKIGTQISATARTGIARFEFPSQHQANMLFKAGDSQNPDTAADVHVVGSNEVTGSATSGGLCGNPQRPVPVYFVAKFDRPFSSHGTWNGRTVHPGGTSSTSRPAGPVPAATSGHGQNGGSNGAWVSFGDHPGQVGMKVAISYVSPADAWQNLKAENPGWDVNGVAAQTGHDWQSLLSRVRVGGGTHNQQVTFYSALYHALLDPTLASDVNGDYAGFDGKVHRVPAGQAHYTSFSGWDIYRSEIPLLAMVAPERTSQMAQSLVDDGQQGGWLPKWPVNSAYTGVMEGDPADQMIAEAYEFGARDFDVRGALAAMIKGADQVPDARHLGQGSYQERPQLSDYLRLGYVPNGPGAQSTTGASLTLEYATSDFAISQFASALGQPGTAKKFLDRSQNWTHVYNRASGYFQPRDVHGAFPTGNPVTAGLNDSGQSGFREGNTTQYSFAVPQNLGGVIATMGGNAAADHRLDQFFTQLNAGQASPHYWAGNETDLLAPWVYDYAGQPYQTATTVHRLLNSVYSDTPGGEPGNDDLGAMSSWYVLAALGLYPTTPGTDVLAMTTPLFPRTQLQLPHGKVEITAPGVSGTNVRARSLTVNGQPSPRDWIPASDLLGHPDAQVNFALTNQAAPAWATRAGDEPPSYPAGPLNFSAKR